MHFLDLYIDEAGRGPLAGPMSVGILMILTPLSLEEKSCFDDSKKFTETQRELLYSQIQTLQDQEKLLSVSSFVSAKEIDQYGMTIAEQIAIVRGIFSLLKLYKLPNEARSLAKEHCTKEEFRFLLSCLKKKGKQIRLFIDGNRDFGLKKLRDDLEVHTIIHGDALIKEIGMASLVAKVSRDRFMKSLPKKYEKYGFAQHKGYGTPLHKTKIEAYGPSDIHRKLFLKRIFPHRKISKQPPLEY